jgi:hypothetical protein
MAAPPTEATLKLGKPRQDRIRPGDDIDYFKVQLKDNNLYTFEAQGSQNGSNTLYDPEIALFNKNGSIIDIVDNFNGRDPLIQYRADKTGTFYLGVRSVTQEPGTYRVRYDLADPAPDEIDNQGVDTELSLKLAQRAQGEIGAQGDEDWYRISLKGGETYTAIARSRNVGDNPDFIADAVIRRSNGNILDNDPEYSGGDPSVPGVDNVFVAPYTGVYFIDVRDLDDQNRGNYSIQVIKGDPFA